MADRVAYRSLMSDNQRWDALELREGDIVISAPSKCGMTLTQRMVALLVFDGPELPGPMSTISPWLDQTVRPIDDVVASLGAQRHRRFIKTHTPLDGLVLDPRVTYLGVGRDPRDAAVSMYHQSSNMDPDRMRALHDAAMPPHPRGDGRHPAGGPPPHHPPGGPPHPPPGAPHEPPSHPPPGEFAPPGADADVESGPLETFHGWMERPIMPPEGMGSLATILHHVNTIWDRRRLPNVAVFHYADLQSDTAAELVRLAVAIGVDLGAERAAELAGYAGLAAMRARAADFAPNTTEGIWRDNERFFRAGGRGEWQEFFTEAEHRRYHHVCSDLVAADLGAWVHGGRRGCDPDTPAQRVSRFRRRRSGGTGS